MRAFKRGMPLPLLAALLLVVAVACAGGSGGQGTSSQPAPDQTSDQPAGDVSQPLVSNAIEVLGKSAERFQQEVESLQAEMEFSVESSAFSMGATADFAFQAPNKMHMTMKLNFSDGTATVTDLSELGNIEMLLLGDEVYMNTPFTGWVSMSLAEMGADAEQLQSLLSSHSPFDYGAIIEQLGGQVKDMGQESLDGGTYNHYRVTMDLADVMAAISDSLGATDSLPSADLSGPVTLDLWVDPDTFLPHKLTAGGTLQIASEAMVFDMTMRFLDYNQPVEIPAPPPDAQPLQSLFQGDSSPFGDIIAGN